MRGVNAGWADEKRFSPGGAKRRNIGGESGDGGGQPIEAGEMHGGSVQNFISLRAILHSGENCVAKGSGIGDGAEHNFGMRDRKSTRLNSSHLVISHAV